MVTTTLAVVAMAGALSTGASPSPGWQTDYAQALTLASAEKKPMAVFVGHDAAKVKQMLADGTISAEAAKLLQDSYICVCLDATQGAGKDLADRVRMPAGLAICDSAGGIQALRHAGTVSGPDLTRQLGQFANVATTSSVSTGPVAAPAAGNCPNGRCPLTAQPAVGNPYTVSPIPVQNYGTPVYVSPLALPGSSCPNGRCPLQR